MLPRWNLGVRQGLEVVEIETAASTAVIALQGAQVLSFVPRGGRDWLWVSERARWAAGAALRGGIPLCFPWFGPHPTETTFPAHGFARTRAWSFLGAREVGGEVAVELSLSDDDATAKLFPHQFAARLTVTIGAHLSLAFDVTNLGSDDLSFEVALHSYFAVSDVDDVAIEGLSGVEFVDKVAGGVTRQESAAQLRIAGEVDRVYDSAGPVTLRDASAGRPLRIESTGARSTVVWNPAPAKTATLGDLAPDAWRRFVCVETGAIGAGRVTLAPGGQHRLTVGYASQE
ncbi:MAG: D-hexose-6-phosphate mutarotase [Polyangia bacterium]